MAKKLGFGLMRMPHIDPANAADVDLEQVKAMVDLFMENGFTYFDTALMYNGFASEAVAKAAIVDRYPRESFTLATKLHAGFFNSFEDRDKVFNGQLEKTGAGYFDYYLLHGIEAGMIDKYEQYDCFNWMLEKKAQGLIRHAGFSFHDTPELLEKILTEHPEMEFVQLQLNYLDWESDWIRAKENYAICEKYGKPVIVMEPVKGGSLAKMPAEAEALLKATEPDLSIPSWAIRFAASLPNVMMVLSGMSTIAQMEDNVSYMKDFKPLNNEEYHIINEAVRIINKSISIPCTACHYCTDECPQNIEIPKYFELFNSSDADNAAKQYKELNAEFGKASDCIGCKSCERHCPQHLEITKYLKDVANKFEQEV